MSELQNFFRDWTVVILGYISMYQNYQLLLFGFVTHVGNNFHSTIYRSTPDASDCLELWLDTSRGSGLLHADLGINIHGYVGMCVCGICVYLPECVSVRACVFWVILICLYVLMRSRIISVRICVCVGTEVSMRRYVFDLLNHVKIQNF